MEECVFKVMDMLSATGVVEYSKLGVVDDGETETLEQTYPYFYVDGDGDVVLGTVNPGLGINEECFYLSKGAAVELALKILATIRPDEGD